MKEEIQATREYLNYLNEHYNNVQKAWDTIKQKCDGLGFDFIYDDFKYHCLNQEIKNHDRSKLCQAEFVPYRRKFFPTDLEKAVYSEEIDKEFNIAWEHHKKNNNHHWEHWTKYRLDTFPNDTGYIVHNICDWMAMSMKFNSTVREYYESNKSTILIPRWAEDLMYKILDCVD